MIGGKTELGKRDLSGGGKRDGTSRSEGDKKGT